MPRPASVISTRNADFQQLLALLSNRTKRQKLGSFLIQGVRPISLAFANSWPMSTLLYDASRSLSDWATDILRRFDGQKVALAPELLQELGEKEIGSPELVAVAKIPADDLSRLRIGPTFLGCLFDRPTSPGNIGTLIRSLDAFGGSGMIITGHAADPYDPKAVRASTGSFFSVPIVRAPSHAQVMEWVAAARARGIGLCVIGTDERAEKSVVEYDFRGPSLLLIGNETSGLSSAWLEQCDDLVRIPMKGTASSLNAASAATIVLYEAARQRMG